MRVCVRGREIIKLHFRNLAKLQMFEKISNNTKDQTSSLRINDSDSKVELYLIAIYKM